MSVLSQVKDPVFRYGTRNRKVRTKYPPFHVIKKRLKVTILTWCTISIQFPSSLSATHFIVIHLPYLKLVRSVPTGTLVIVQKSPLGFELPSRQEDSCCVGQYLPKQSIEFCLFPNQNQMSITLFPFPSLFNTDKNYSPSLD